MEPKNSVLETLKNYNNYVNYVNLKELFNCVRPLIEIYEKAEKDKGINSGELISGCEVDDVVHWKKTDGFIRWIRSDKPNGLIVLLPNPFNHVKIMYITFDQNSHHPKRFQLKNDQIFFLIEVNDNKQRHGLMTIQQPIPFCDLIGLWRYMDQIKILAEQYQNKSERDFPTLLVEMNAFYQNDQLESQYELVLHVEQNAFSQRNFILEQGDYDEGKKHGAWVEYGQKKYYIAGEEIDEEAWNKYHKNIHDSVIYYDQLYPVSQIITSFLFSK